MRCYVRTLSMVLACAVQELYPKTDLRIEHPISKGYFCTLRNDLGERIPITQQIVQDIKERVHLIISEDRPIIIEEKQTKEVIRLFGERNSTETTLFQAFGNPYCRYFRMGDFID